jgi:uncharacterized Zn finger protein (UPF0148 family)
MKVWWKLKPDTDDCPRCGGMLMSCRNGDVMCAMCAKKEIQRLRKLLKLKQNTSVMGGAESDVPCKHWFC